MENNRLPPHDIAAEEAVIGSLLIDGGAIQSLTITPDDFYHEPVKIIFAACQSLKNKHIAINQITVAEELDRQGKLESCGGVAILSHYISIVPSPLDIDSYAHIIKECSVRRRLITASEQIRALAFNSEETNATLEQADTILLNIRRNYGRTDIVTPRDRADLLFERYTNLNNQENSIALPTGFSDLDKVLGGGFFPGELIICGADTGMGKSTFGQNVAINQSIYGNILFCSGEMTVEGLSDREIAGIVGRPIGEVRKGHYQEDLYVAITNAVGEVSERRIYYYRRSPLTCDGIKQAIITMQSRNGGCRCVVIDYLQKIQLKSRDERYVQIGEITSTLADIAHEFDVTIVLLVQLKNKDIEYRQDKRPNNGDIYESGRIEQDADVILLLYRVDKYFTRSYWESNFQANKESHGWAQVYQDGKYPEGIAELIISKQRQGTGRSQMVKLLWVPKEQAYRHLRKE